MPTSDDKPKPRDGSTLAREFFYRDGPLRADEALHEPILEGGDHAAATAGTRAMLKKRGWTDAKIDAFLGV